MTRPESSIAPDNTGLLAYSHIASRESLEPMEFQIDPDRINQLKFTFAPDFTYTILYRKTQKDFLIELQGGDSLLAPDLNKGVRWIIPFNKKSQSVETLIHWASKNATELNLLRRLLVNLVSIVDHWEVIQDHGADLLIIAIEFLTNNHHLHPHFPVLKNRIIIKFYELTQNTPKYTIEAAQFNRELYFDDENQAWFDGEYGVTTREKLASDTVELLIGYDRKNGIALTPEQKYTVTNELEEAKEWFLTRYDLKTAVEIVIHLHLSRGKALIKCMILNVPEFIAALIFLSSLAILLFEIPAVNTCLMISPWIKKAVQWSHAGILIGGYVIVPLLLFSLLYKFKSPNIIKNMQFFLPRLIAGIIAGYLLLMSDEVWRFIRMFDGAAENPLVNFTLLNRFLPLLGVFVYILIEISHVEGITNTTKKARFFFSRAYAYAIIMGLVISDIFGNSMTGGKDSCALVKEAQLGFFTGYIYPEVILFLSPLALFVGIVLQLLWDDKKLTDKI